MNNRIKELAAQAKFMTEEDINKQISYNTELKAFAGKFAELIVQEIRSLNKGQLVVIPKDQSDWDGHNYGFTAAVHGLDDLIKEHFGVE